MPFFLAVAQLYLVCIHNEEVNKAWWLLHKNFFREYGKDFLTSSCRTGQFIINCYG